MNRILVFLLLCNLLACKGPAGETDAINVLILSGKNNHDWESTTPFLREMYEESGLFNVRVTLQPDTLKGEDLHGMNVLVSNWSSFPDMEYRWPEETEKAFVEFLRGGGGLVTIHASSTAFFNWPEFGEFTTGAWIKGTRHGPQSATFVEITNEDHPVSRGMSGFTTWEELWIDADSNENFEVLGTATNEMLRKEGLSDQAAVMVGSYGEGRIFHTTLGHHVQAMRNTGCRTLILRGTEWAASGEVTQELPQELFANPNGSKAYSWVQSDTSFALVKGEELVWQYNFREYHLHAFFHPVFVGGNNMTSLSPDDHPWHVGQWFSWKFVNGTNYWEYVSKDEYRKEGSTEITGVRMMPNPDFSARIELDIAYHPEGGETVLKEKQSIEVSAPNESGQLSMDYQFDLEAVAEEVVLDRTPISGEPDGKGWGGYGGLSLRFNQDFMDSKILGGSEAEEFHGKAANWLYMEFTGLKGERVGSQMLVSPDSNREEAAWYVWDDANLPFYYFSPAYLFGKPKSLKKGEKLRLNYRINHFPRSMSKPELEQEYQNYLKP